MLLTCKNISSKLHVVTRGVALGGILANACHLKKKEKNKKKECIIFILYYLFSQLSLLFFQVFLSSTQKVKRIFECQLPNILSRCVSTSGY